MRHLLKTKCIDSRANVHILASTSVSFTLPMVQVLNLALVETKRITVYYSKIAIHLADPLCFAVFTTINFNDSSTWCRHLFVVNLSFLFSLIKFNSKLFTFSVCFRTPSYTLFAFPFHPFLSYCRSLANRKRGDEVRPFYFPVHFLNYV